MSRALVIAVALLGGCQPIGALELEVATSPDVMSVRLYIGVGGSTPQAITPQGFTSSLKGQSWPLDEFASKDVVVLERADDDVVFQLERGDKGEDKLAVAILVGFDGFDAPIAAARLLDIKIPDDRVERHIVSLIDLSTQQAYATTWPKGANTCAAYVGPGDGRAVDMVVLADDPDCDAAEIECDPNAFGGARTASLDEVNCLTEQLVVLAGGDTTNACVLGGPPCIDGEGMQGGCHTTPYCVPQTVCTACGESGLDCAKQLKRPSTYLSLPTHIECITGRTAASVCTTDMTVKLGEYLPAGTECTGEIAITNVGGTFAKSMTSALGPTVTVDSLQTSCSFTLASSGPFTIASDATFVVSGLVAGMTTNQRGFAIPVVVYYELDDPCGTTCDVRYPTTAGDLLAECLTSPILTP